MFSTKDGHNIIDKELVEKRFTRSIQTYNQNAIVQKKMAHELVEIASKSVTETTTMLELGCGGGLLTKEVLSRYTPSKYYANDMADISDYYTNNNKKKNIEIEFIKGDAETILYPQDVSVLWSGATLQWFHDYPSFFAKVALALKPNGVAAFSSFGKNNYSEIRSIIGEGLPYQSIEELAKDASPLLRIVQAHEYKIQLWFNDPIDILKHIKATGVGGLRQPKWNKTRLKAFIESYGKFYHQNYGYSLTYHPIFLVFEPR